MRKPVSPLAVIVTLALCVAVFWTGLTALFAILYPELGMLIPSIFIITFLGTLFFCILASAAACHE